ncbi:MULTISPECIES: nitrate- and nitrite sensing domain-containing protein [unclassified Streptomyces]|uniref:nitrate- and nitrite sensing domain-containing protein n=1 Tax=unclassified Streptomyces TaxID=2593676 RepID=UPI001F0C0938|nr:MULTISPECIES: nitrate- and nitrite sensing domain-containing protein [unclassified Streptomyces]
MQKTRPRRKGKQTAPTGDAEQKPTVGRGRPTHVRNRLIVAVAVVAAAIAGAGAPSVIAASGRLSDAQDLVTLAERTQDALSLAHSLADERDEVVPYIAAGRPESKAPSEQHSARVDRQVEELRADADTSQALRDELDAVAAVRRAALSGKSSALEAHQAYSTAITQLHRLAEQLAEQTPPRAGSGAHALAELDGAVQQAAATRGLLLAALSVPRTTRTVIDPITGLPTTSTSSSEADTKRRDALTAAALQARLRSDAALADFREGAPETARASYDSTVNGPEVDSAEKYLARLTDAPTLSDGELDTSTKKLAAALTARIDAMRGVESGLFEQRTKDLAQLRDEDVTELEVRIAVLGALMLLAVGIATAMARTLTRPLSVLRRGSARLAEAEDPAAEEAVAFTGRNDEFAQVARSVNALHAHAAALAERIATLEADRKHLVGQRQKMADAREELRSELAESAAQLERVRAGIGGTFVNLALRTLGLVERQLGVIEGLEEREDDPERLATLFKLDHFATVMRRHSENLLVLAGTEHGRNTAGPVPLVDVVRAAVSEIERYERVRIAALPPHAHIAGFAADDLSHLLAELLENATAFSPPDLPVEVSGWLLENGEVMLSVQDEGIGMAADRLERLNSRLADVDPEATYDADAEDGLGLGLYVVARLAQRHGVRVRLREQKQGGIAAVVVLPDPLLAPATPTAVPASVSGSYTVSLPGADAEANSNVLQGRTEPDDPLVALAEQSLRDAPASDHADAPAQGEGDETEAAREDMPVPGAEAEPEPEAADAPAPVDGAGPEPGRSAAPTSDRVEMPARGAGDGLEAGRVDVPARGDGDGPEVGRVDVPGAGREAEPESGAVDGSVSSRAEVSASGRVAESESVPAPSRGDASAFGRVEVPAQGDGDGPEVGRVDAPGAGREAEPQSGAVDGSVSSRAEVSASGRVAESESVPAPSRGDASAFGRVEVPARGDGDGPEVGRVDAPGVSREAEPESGAVDGSVPGRGDAGVFGRAAEPESAPEVPEPDFGDASDASASGRAGEAASVERAGSEPGRGDVSAAGDAGVSGSGRGDGGRGPWADDDADGHGERPAETTMALLIPAQPDGADELPARPDVTPDHGTGSDTAPGAHEPERPGAGHAVDAGAARPGAGHAVEPGRAETGAPDARPGAVLPRRPVDDRGRAEHARVEDEEPVTAKGLPKRTPKTTAPAPLPRPRTGGVDAEALRRRLGGFHRGADAGRRDAEAELAERTGTEAHNEETTGGTVEEASS